MELWEAEKLAWSEMQKWELDKKGWSFDFDFAKCRLGRCNYLTKLITLAVHATLTYGEDVVLDVIRHEIAHALCNRKEGHGPKWKKMCLIVGCKPDRLFNEPQDIIATTKKWIGTCPVGHLSGRLKEPKTGIRYSCGTCSPTFNAKNEVVFTINPLFIKE